MRFGIYLNPQTPGPEADGRIINEVLGQVDLAEKLGFSDVWITDHQFTGYNAYSEPLILAAAISQRNPTLRIGFAVAVLPLRHPIRFATECNLLDQLSQGRLVVGLGAGNSPDEYRGYGLETSERHDMMREFVDVLDRAWEAPDGGFEYSGRYYNGVVKGRIIPAPFQKPRPHIAYGTATPETLEMIGRRGWSLLVGPQDVSIISARLNYYLRGMDDGALSDLAKERAWHDSGVLRQIYVAAPGEDWHDSIGEQMAIYNRQSAKANSGIDDLPKDDLEKRLVGYQKTWLFAGTSDEIIERLRPFAELGFQHLMCWLNFGQMPDKLVQRSILRFTAEVAPALGAMKPNQQRIDDLRRELVGAATRPADY